jgi:ubiquinone/menaquinone biosynthesis C-methylase UbiE
MSGDSVHNSHALFDFGGLASGYERWYETPAGKSHDLTQKSDVRRFLEPARQGVRLLDVGCGTGHWDSFFAGMGYQVMGIDVAPAMIEVARAALPTGLFQVADACDLPFPDASFDVVVSMATLESRRDAQSACTPESAPPRGRQTALLLGPSAFA